MKIITIIFLIVILIITVLIINSIWSGDNENAKQQTDKVRSSKEKRPRNNRQSRKSLFGT